MQRIITFGGALRIWIVNSPSSKVIASPSSILINVMNMMNFEMMFVIVITMINID